VTVLQYIFSLLELVCRVL